MSELTECPYCVPSQPCLCGWQRDRKMDEVYQRLVSDNERLSRECGELRKRCDALVEKFSERASRWNDTAVSNAFEECAEDLRWLGNSICRKVLTRASRICFRRTYGEPRSQSR